MKKLIKANYTIFLIFFFVLLTRLFFAFNTPYYSSPEAYDNLRNIENVKETFKPIIYDELSYGGNVSFFPPLFYYVMAIFFLIPFMLKIVPALLISSLVFVVYKIAKDLFKNKNAAILSGLMAGFLPIAYIKTLNQISVFSLFLPLMFYTIYCFINIDQKKYMNRFIALSFILPLLHPLSFLLVVTLIFYYVIAGVESLKVSKLRNEGILFFVFITFIIEFIIFKGAFLKLGINIIWQNIPKEVILNYFRNFDMLDIIYKVGFLPMLMGISGAVLVFTRYKSKDGVVIGSFLLSALFLMVARLVEFETGALFLGVSLSIMSALFIDKMFKYISLTKFSHMKKYFNYFLFLLVFLTLVLPSFFVSNNVIKSTISDNEFSVLTNLGEDDDIMLSSMEEGYYITGIAKKKSVIDKNFLMVDNIDERYNDVSRIYTTSFEKIALQLLHKYDVDYIYISDKTKEIYNKGNLDYLDNEECFRQIEKAGRVEVYRIMC